MADHAGPPPEEGRFPPRESPSETILARVVGNLESQISHLREDVGDLEKNTLSREVFEERYNGLATKVEETSSMRITRRDVKAVCGTLVAVAALADILTYFNAFGDAVTTHVSTEERPPDENVTHKAATVTDTMSPGQRKPTTKIHTSSAATKANEKQDE